MPAQPVIDITTPMPPPEWALLERELLKANSEAIEAFYNKYFDERGYFLHTPRWGTLDGTDDAYEQFNYWTLLYSFGASETVFQLYKNGHEGHLRQYKEVTTKTTEVAKDGCYYKEFMPMSDWLHQGEGMQCFLFEGLCNPIDVLYQKRIRRFAGFYLNEDPDAPNYDPEHKIIRSLWNGSKGPMLRVATTYDWVGDPVPGKFHLLHSSGGRKEMLDFEEHYPAMLDFFKTFLQTEGDNPLNLIATIVPLHAYMLAHEEKYKNWLLEYVNAWKERTITNGGTIPANIGLDGTIGGAADGKWYKGTYSWSHVGHNLFHWGMWPAFSNALLLTGDQSYIDILRRQVDNMYENKKIINGETALPFNFDEDGWTNWSAPATKRFSERLLEIYLWSMDRDDLARIPMTGWIAYLEGKNDGYPEEALRDEFTFIRNAMEKMRNDPTTPDSRLADWTMDFNPAAMHELYRLMHGGFFTGYYTGRIKIAHCRARYFDPGRRRAGIPEDVAVLVTQMDDSMTKMIIVNTNQIEPRTVIVQTGAYGEHQCEKIETGDKVIPVNHRYFTVVLSPGAGTELTTYIRRYANQPTLAFPWHGDTVPRH